MKNIFTSKKSLWLVAFVALLVTSCFKLASVTLSTHEVKQTGKVTLTATIVNDYQDLNGNPSDIDQNGIGMCGVRIPVDWSVDGVPTCINTCKDGNKEIPADNIEKSEFYTAFLEYCYPKEGYKWVGFQTKNDEKFLLRLPENGDDCVTLSINLVSGETVGDYVVDLMVGSWQSGDLWWQNGTLSDYYSVEDGKYDFSKLFSVNGLGIGECKGNLLRASTITSHEQFERTQLMNPQGAYIAIAKPLINYDNEDGLDRWNKEEAEQKELLGVTVTNNPTLGVEDIWVNSLRIVGDRGGIRVVLESADDAEVAIYNVEGKMVDSKVMAGGEALLKAAKGTCIVKVVKGDKKIVKKIFVK